MSILEGAEMDLNVQNGKYELFIEQQKGNVKEKVLRQYVMLRKASGFTQQDIADRTGMMRANIARIESGRGVPTIEVLVKLADALDMELDIRMVPKTSAGTSQTSAGTSPASAGASQTSAGP